MDETIVERNHKNILFKDATGISQIFPFQSSGFIILATIAIVLLIQYFRNGSVRKKRRGEDYLTFESLSGPKPLPLPFPFNFVGNMHELLFTRFRDLAKEALVFGEKYGECIKVTFAYQKFVGLNSPELAQTLLKSPNLGHVRKAPLVYDNMKPFITNGVLVSSGKFWQTQRKTIMKTMTFPFLRAYMDLMNKNGERMVSDLGELFADDQPHTINALINGSFMNVICEMITGMDIHNTVEGIQFHHNFQTWKDGVSTRIYKPWLMLDLIWKLHPMSRRYLRAVGELDAFARRRIAEHRLKITNGHHIPVPTKEDNDDDNDNDRNTAQFRSLLDILIEAGMSDDQIVDEVNMMLFGGHETTATNIHVFLFMMALHPTYQEECQQEVDAIFDDPNQLKDGKITFDSLSNLKFVERCLLETLRIYPAIFLYVRMLDEPMIFEYNGKKLVLEAGTNAGVCTWLLHRNKKYFPNPEKFDPDRFLPDEVSKRHSHAFLPFSAGPRNCLGLKFAMMEMKVIAAYIIRNFQISTTDKEEDIPVLPMLTLTPERDYSFVFTRRSI